MGSTLGTLGTWASALGVLCLALVLAVVDTDAGVRTLVSLRSEAESARRRLAGLERSVATLEGEVEALQHDPSAIERAIREDLEMVRPGEWVVRFAPSGDTNPRFP